MGDTPEVVDDLPEVAPANDTLTEQQAATDIESLLTDDLQIGDPDPKGDDDEPQDILEEEQEPEPEPEGSPTGGKYVASNAKFKLADGSEITVGELARNNLFQRDYSKKTEELARDRESFAKEKAEVVKVSQKLREEREFMVWFAEQAVPKQPVPPTVSAAADPMAHLQYSEDLRHYNTFVQAWQAFKNGQEQDNQRQAGETQAEANARAKKEVETLFEKIPVLKDQAKATKFFDALEKGASESYGFTQTDIANALKQDHRYGLVLRDALAYRRAKAKAPEVQKQLAAKPRVIKGSARTTQDQQIRRAIAKSTERLRQTGSFNDGVAAIESLLG